MVIFKKCFISEEQPQITDGLWFKKVSGGYSLYVIEGGIAQPMKLINDNGTTTPSDDVVEPSVSAVKTELIGTAQDAGSANTIKGAKKYADGVGGAVVGTADDTAEDMTLYGLKAYVDAQITALNNAETPEENTENVGG